MDLLSPKIEVVRSCLREGGDPNTTIDGDANDVYPLAVQSFMGRPDIVQLLLEHGANPQLGRESTGETPLHHVTAAASDDDSKLQIVRHLLGAGADPNRRCNKGVLSINFMRDVRVRGETPLHRAAAYCSARIINELIAGGASTKLKDLNGDSPLSWASLHRRENDILSLLAYGEFRL